MCCSISGWRAEAFNGRGTALFQGAAVIPTAAFEDGRLELSNNRAERSIKPFAVGRKNFLFVNTPLGAQASAVICSLIETAKETGLDPFRYLAWVLKNAPGLDRNVNGWAKPPLPANAPMDCRTT